MTMDVTIGDFSRMTHLTVKTLRHYHRVGLLEPAEVDPRTGYRYYSTDQVPAAQVIRRFRDLDMPIDEVRSVLTAPDQASRNRLITRHLDRLQGQLEHTQSAVESLRTLLDPPDAQAAVAHRSVPPTEAIAICANVGHDEVGAWWSSGLVELRATAQELGWEPTGPAGGLFANGLFEEERGDAMLFLPVAGASSDLLPPEGRVRTMVVPGADLAVLVHHGSEDSIDLAYGAVGVYVTTSGLAALGPIRETYLVDASTTADASLWCTEVGWPITADRPADGR
jgi:DNA-binding transcriptional MerR regulator/effector-binding domain-containing protein